MKEKIYTCIQMVVEKGLYVNAKPISDTNTDAFSCKIFRILFYTTHCWLWSVTFHVLLCGDFALLVMFLYTVIEFQWTCCLQELQDMSKDPPSGCSAGPVGDDSKFSESVICCVMWLSDDYRRATKWI